jgi:hypothetical protein
VGSSTSLPAQDNSESVACPRSSGPEEKCRAEYLRNRASDDFFSTRHPAQGSSEGSACPRGSGPNEDRRADAEDLAEPARCKATPIRSKRNIAQGAVADIYRIDPDPICGGLAVANQKVATACLGDSDDDG